MRLQAKTVVITGASSGIGKATTARCLNEGARVVAVSDRPAELEQLAAEFASLGEIHPAVCDVSDPQQVRMLAEQVAGMGGAH
ncbi:MAG: SDR family NAD(P)-dependent oxidoreductase, partial [Ktedonobacteraceae bacterium]